MADSLSSPQSFNLNPPKPEPNNPPSQPDRHPESSPQPLPSAPTPPPPALNPSPISNPPAVPAVPTPVPLYAPPAVSGAPLFRPALPQFTPVPGAVNYNNPGVSSAPGMANPAARAPVMPYLVQVPVPGQPSNPTLRPYVPFPNGYAAMPPPGVPGYSAPYTAVARPAFPPRPPGHIGVLPAVPRPPISFIPGVRPIIPPVVRPGLVPVTPAEKPQTTIYVGKIAPTADNDFMLSLLKLCGPVKSWKRVQDPTDGSLKRFGFCEFESAEGVLRSLRLLNKLNIDGQELMLNLNEATKGYLLRYIEKKTENAKKDKETEAASAAEKEGDAVPDAEKNGSAKPSVEDLKKDDSETGNKDNSESGRKDESDSGKTEPDYRDFGLVTDEDREADKEILEKLTSMIDERLKSLPPPPPHAPADASGIADSGASAKLKARDSETVGEDQNGDETTSDNKASSEQDKTESSSPDRSRRYDRGSRERDRAQDLNREKEREIERYEREAERECIRKEREQRRKIEDAEREYEERLRDWEYREREKEKQRQYEREREKERERKRKKEIIYDEEDAEDDSRRWRHRSALEEKRKKRQREKEDDLADRMKEEEEMAEAKKRAEEEKQRLLQREEIEQVSDCAVNRNENSAMIEELTVEEKDEGDHNGGNHIGEEVSQIGSGDGLTSTVGASSDMQNDNNAPLKKLGFGLSGSGKRTSIPSVFHADDDDEAQKEKKMRPLVPIDYSNEEMEAVQPAAGMPQPNLAAAAEFAKRISSNSMKEERPESERERSRRSHDRMSQWEKDQHDDKSKEKGLHREHGPERSRVTQDNKKLLDAKQLIDMIPKTKEDLFSYEINWALYDQHDLHERMRPWISKKITEFLGEEEKSLVDYIVSSTQEHIKASEMLDTLKSILDEEAEMFVLKMWRMLIYEIKRVETGLHLRSRT